MQDAQNNAISNEYRSVPISILVDYFQHYRANVRLFYGLLASIVTSSEVTTKSAPTNLSLVSQNFTTSCACP